VATTADLAGVLPRLRFAVRDVSGRYPAAVPTLRAQVAIEAEEGAEIRSIVLDIQVQIAARARRYEPEEQTRLLELFGTPERWASTLRTLPWLRTTIVVPAFAAHTTVAIDLPCTYDLEVTAARYFAALGDGEVPLEFLFAGSVFFTDGRGALQTARIGWDQEAAYRMPVAVWREMMDRHFPDAAWLRLGRATFDRLLAFKAEGMFMSWDAAVEALLTGEGPG
jgi:hypothetical protein